MSAACEANVIYSKVGLIHDPPLVTDRDDVVTNRDSGLMHPSALARARGATLRRSIRDVCMKGAKGARGVR